MIPQKILLDELPKNHFDLRYYKEAGDFALQTRVGGHRVDCVSIEPGPDGKGVFIVATDGHTCGIFIDEDGFVEKPKLLIFDPEIARFALRPSSKDRRLICINDDQSIDIMHQNAGCTSFYSHVRFAAVVEEKYVQFPEWRKLFTPALKDLGKGFHFNGEYLKRCHRVEKASGKESLSLWEATDGLSVLRCAREDFVAFVAPMNYGTIDALPALVKMAIEKEAKQ